MKIWKIRYKMRRIKDQIKWYKLILDSAWDARFEFDTEVYYPRMGSKRFMFSVIIALILNRICWNCKGEGMTGYEEREACSKCEGFGIDWKNEKEPDWAAMAEGMEESEKEKNGVVID